MTREINLICEKYKLELNSIYRESGRSKGDSLKTWGGTFTSTFSRSDRSDLHIITLVCSANWSAHAHLQTRASKTLSNHLQNIGDDDLLCELASSESLFIIMTAKLLSCVSGCVISSRSLSKAPKKRIRAR